jgi:hypothetical protein
MLPVSRICRFVRSHISRAISGVTAVSGLQAHLLERVRAVALRHDVEMGRLRKIDLQRVFQGALKGRIAGRVHEVGQHHLLESRAGAGLRPHIQPAAGFQPQPEPLQPSRTFGFWLR